MKLLVCCVFLVSGLVSSEALLDWFSRTFGSCRNDRDINQPAIVRDPVCEAKADRGECAFYDCFEDRYPCGRCGFAKDYGVYNCEKFTLPNYYNEFNLAGQQWINATGRCLTMKLKTLYQREGLSCRMSKTVMLGAISDCYTDNGFCDIMVDNVRALARVYEVDSLLQSMGVIREVFQIAGHCAQDAAARFTRKIFQLITEELGGPFHG